jgi:hypothetical protein
MMHKHTIDLLERLLLATEESRIQWAEVPGKTAYSYMAGEFVVLVDVNAERTTFRLTDAKGRTLEQADTDALMAEKLGTGTLASAAVKNIHAMAKRQAMGTDTAIASVMEHLQGLDPAEDSVAPAAAQTAEPVAEPAPDGEDIAIEGEAESPAVIDTDLDAKDGLEENFQTPDQPIEPPMDAPQIVEDLPDAPRVEAAEAPQKKQKRKRSLFNPFGRKK